MEIFTYIFIFFICVFLLGIIRVISSLIYGTNRKAKLTITDPNDGRTIISSSGIGYGGAVVSLAKKEYERTKSTTNLEKLIYARDTVKRAMEEYSMRMKQNDYAQAKSYLELIQQRVNEQQKIEDDYREYCKARGLNPDVSREFIGRERSKVTASIRYDVLKRDGFRCIICGATATDGAKLVVDHIIPVSKGGKSEMNNLRTLCDRCNAGKSDKIE